MSEALDAYASFLQGLPPIAADAIRYGNGLVFLALLFVPLERAFALRPAPVRTAGERGVRVAWYFLTSLLPARLLALPLFALAWFASRALPGAVHEAAAALPAPLRLAAALVLAEIGGYLGHRAMHASPWLWRFHAVHHASRHLDWLANVRAHPLDLVVTRFCALMPLVLLGLARPSGAQADWVPLAVVLAGSTWGYVIHANVRWRGGWLAHVVSTPAFHHAHHAREPSSRGHRHGNYAALLPVVDRVFGTLRRDEAPWPAAYGIEEALAPDLLGQLADPFAGGPSPGRANG
jgi:sterol desaturase/sphingolipid hydroxylase (fatty acid hydroxylase superfamily)